MLAKKYYAQRGNSSGSMNTRAVAGSNYTALTNKKSRFSFENYYGPDQDRKTSAIRTAILTQEVVGCVKPVPFEDQPVSVETCPRRSHIIGGRTHTARQSCHVHKMFPVMSGGTYLNYHRHQRSCPQNDPVPVNNGC